ncbi:unnamed protein product [Ilex paraguariensis]|uniref:Uncharacterized protein n=1 Tax=Ilex paraguariensis TaxID=185542 RepID=A0ABC8R7W6_9AQUA
MHNTRQPQRRFGIWMQIRKTTKTLWKIMKHSGSLSEIPDGLPDVKKKDFPKDKRRAIKANVSESKSESTTSEDSSSQEDKENFKAFASSYSSPPGETSQSEVEERPSPTTVVKDLEEELLSPTKEVADLNVEVSMSEDETESIKDLQDAYNQLYEKCFKQRKMILLLSMRLKTSEDDKKALHVDLVKSKAHVYGPKEYKKSFKDKLSLVES